MIIPYQEVKRRCEQEWLVDPAVERSKAFGMSFGYSAAGYDVRIAQTLCVPPSGFVKASTIEHFNIPNDLLPWVVNKSTLARLGLDVLNTVAEPGWRGYLTLELANHSSNEIILCKGSPIAQIIFIRLSEPTTLPYQGKYQDQPNRPVNAIFENES